MHDMYHLKYDELCETCNYSVLFVGCFKQGRG